MTLLIVALPALPLALLILRFRDTNDSHLVSIVIVLAWLLGIVLGAILADRTQRSLKRVSAYWLVASALHALLTLGVVLQSFGASMAAFDGKKPTYPAQPTHQLSELLVQPLMSIATDSGRISRSAQWLGFVANSLTWGAALVALLLFASGVLRLVNAMGRGENPRT